MGIRIVAQEDHLLVKGVVMKQQQINPIALVLSLVNREDFCNGKYDFGAVLQREAGSNCGDSVVLVSPEGETLDCRSMDSYVFGSGSQCGTVSRKWREIHARLGLPEEFTWETAILVAASRTWSSCMLHRPEALLSAWAYVLASPAEALGLGREEQQVAV